MTRPSVTTRCVADQYHGPNERIVEFSDAKGNGGLINLRTQEDGTLSVHLYRMNGVVVTHRSESFT